MDDVENAVEDEAVGEEDEYEYPDDFSTQLINLAISAARQAFSFGGVVMFPVFYTIFEIVIVNFKLSRDMSGLEQNHFRYNVVTVSSISGLIVGAVLLHFIGRKLTVIAVNLSECVFFLYAYTIKLNFYTSYKVVVVHHVLTGVGYITYFIYLSEVTSPLFRAFFMGWFWLAIIIFSLIIKEDFLWTTRVNTLLLYGFISFAVSFVLSVFIPESPFWLTLKGNPEKAEETFRWLRAGDADRAEFNQMLARAESVLQNSFRTFVTTPTFVACLVFNIFLIMGAFDTCELKKTFLHDYWSPQHRWLTHPEHLTNKAVLRSHEIHDFAHQIYGQLIFLLFNFVVPRKVLYLVSYVLSVVMVTPLRLKMLTAPTLTFMGSYCNVVPNIGVSSLNQILPVEVYPIALREIGVAFSGILQWLHYYSDKFSTTTPRDFFTPLNNDNLNRTTIYTHFYISLIGVPLILIFMPETKDKNIYELDGLKLDILPIFRGSTEEGEGPMAEDESTSEPEADE